MPDYGLGLAYGYENMNQDLRQRIMDQLAQKQQGFENQQREREMALREQEARQRAEEHAANLKERALNVQSLIEQRAQAGADRTASLYGPGDMLPPEAVASYRGGGLGGLVRHQDPTLASRQTIPGQPPVIQMRGQMVSAAPEQAGGDYTIGTAAQREQRQKDASAAQFRSVDQARKQAEDETKQREAEARIQHLTDIAEAAQQRLQLEGGSQSARLAAQQANLELSRAKLQWEQEKARLQGQQWVVDAQGNWKLMDKSQLQNLPAGATPTRPTTPLSGLSGFIRGLFNNAPATSVPDPNFKAQ